MSRLSKLPWLEIMILLLAGVFRLIFLDIKPPHFDEGINGWFADQMTKNGYYKYDPGNYHGPLHFYAVFLSQTLFGRNLWALRIPAVIPAILAVWAILRFRTFFGVGAVRWAALAMAVSPAFVFYGRYSIHESWQVLFLLLCLHGILGLWERGDVRSFFMVVFSAVGMVLTKETYVLHLTSFALAGAVLWGYQKLVPSLPDLAIAKQQWAWRNVATASGLGVLIIVFFYSGTFLDWTLLKGLYQTFGAWFHTGVEAAGHEKSSYQFGPVNYYWLSLMVRYEWPALVGLLACFRYLAPSDARLRYVAIYAGGVLLAYSQIRYKTPWCIISIIWPFCLLFGTFVDEMAKAARSFRPIVFAGAGLVLIASAVESIRLNFREFTNEKEPYVYVQTYEEIETATKPLLALAKADPSYYHMPGLIMLESYYPLPWILGDFTGIAYYGIDNAPAPYDQDFIIVERSKDDKVEPKLSGAYYKRNFRLRDAQAECTIYFAAKTFQPWFQTAPEIPARNSQ